LIELTHVSKDFGKGQQEVHAVRDVSLSIDKGEIFGIIGFSGAGKSTLVRCINLLERPTAGTVMVDNKDLTALSARELRQARKKIGMIFQHFNLMPSRTVAGNVAYSMPDVTLAVINGNYALDSGLTADEALYKESDYTDNSYFGLIAARTEDAENPVYLRIVEAYQSQKTIDIFNNEFAGFFLPAWELDIG
jgi:ABC-type dipeptide/oligopeptide/nickel transport system ATPase subunit